MKKVFGILLVGFLGLHSESVFSTVFYNGPNSCWYSNVTACDNEDICDLSVAGGKNHDEIVWRTLNDAWGGAAVLEAKRRGLTCGVGYDKFSCLSSAQLCQTSLTGYTIEIQRRNLNCNGISTYKENSYARSQTERCKVKQGQSDPPSEYESAHDNTVCMRSKGKARYSNKWEDEAQRRSLDCAKPSGDVAKVMPKTGEKPQTPKPSKEAKPKIVKPDNSAVLQASSGSGFAVSNDGFMITNNHVIDGCKKVFVHSRGNQIPARVVTYDKRNDLALLKADFKPEAVFPLSANRPELLQDIYVAGYPFGMNLSTSVKVTKGIISSLTGIENNFSEIQIDAALQSGNSGGPILDDKGNVVGVAVSKLDVKFALKNFGAIPENTNFGIKSSVVGSILDSNGVNVPPANKKPISKSQLGKQISKGTYYISCWMTMAQIEKMRTKKVMFSDLD